MPYKSRYPFSSPTTSLPSLIFSSSATIASDTPIILDAKRSDTHSFTLLSFREWSKRFAAGLRENGLKPGDRVMLFSGNDMFTPVVVMGVIMAGGIYTSANPAYTPRELAHQLKDCQPKFVLAAANCHERALKGAKLAELPTDCLFLFEEPDLRSNGDTSAWQKKSEMKQHWSTLVSTPSKGAAFEWEELDTLEKTNRTAILIYSSGTTGLPKGVECSHRNLVSNICQLVHMQTGSSVNPASTTSPSPSSPTNSQSERRSLCALPMYHGLGLIYYVCVAPKAGIQVYLMQQFSLLDLLSHIQCFRITELLLVPPMLVMMAKHADVKAGKYDLSSVGNVVAGAAPLGIEVTREFEDIWKDTTKLTVRQAWGMSEAPCIFFCHHTSDPSTTSSTSIGELVPGSEAKIVDDAGFEVSRGQRGELWIRGPSVMKGYWNNTKATQDTLTPDGWLKTGDIAYAEGSKFWMVDRKKELIKVKGAQVAPAELEALLLECPGVGDAAVIGVPTATGDECPRAYVVLQPSASCTLEEIEKWTSERVARFKRLTGGVVRVDVIPKNPSGKILRRQLRDLAAKEDKRESGVRARL